jgi:hypothetical protein
MESQANGETPKRSGLHKSEVVESAIVLTIVSAICYAIGDLVHLRDSKQLGIPSRLLPEVATESTILIGALHLLVLILVGLLVWFVVLLLIRFLPRDTVTALWQNLKVILARHPRFYPVLGSILFASLVLITIYWLPLSYTESYEDARLPDLIEIKTSEKVSVGDPRNLKYVSHRDGWVVLKRLGRKEFVVLKEEDVPMLVLAKPRENRVSDTVKAAVVHD